MGVESLRSCLSSAAVVVVLVVGPNMLGLGADILPQILGLALTWFSSIGLEQLPIPVGVLVLTVVAYVLLTPGRRRGRADLKRGLHAEKERRFLPPLEIVLLQIGNLSYLTFAVILAVSALGGLFYLLRILVTHPRLIETNFTASLGLAVIAMLVPLRRAALRAQSWEGFPQEWLRWGGQLAVAIAAFGLIGAARGLGPLRIDMMASQLRPQTLTLLYAGLVAGLVSSSLIAKIARARGCEKESIRRLLWFAPAFGLAWVGNVGMSALFLDGVYLTLQAHLGEP